MLGKKKSLRDLLDPKEISGVDALLRRISFFLSQSDNLTSEEKAEVLEGQKALSRLFYLDCKD